MPWIAALIGAGGAAAAGAGATAAGGAAATGAAAGLGTAAAGSTIAGAAGVPGGMALGSTVGAGTGALTAASQGLTSGVGAANMAGNLGMNLGTAPQGGMSSLMGQMKDGVMDYFKKGNSGGSQNQTPMMPQMGLSDSDLSGLKSLMDSISKQHLANQKSVFQRGRGSYGK